MMRWLLVVAVFVLMFLHNDFWNRDHEPRAVFGWVPWDLAYHVAWVGAGALLLAVVMRVAWGRSS